MSCSESFIFAALFFIVLINFGNGVRTKDKMYENIDSVACYRRLNATHQVGCTSVRGGSTGAIHFCETETDIDFIIKNATAPPYIPIIPTQFFTRETLKKLKSSKKISGLVIYYDQKPISHFSHDNQCPNPDSSLKNTCGGDKPLWNPHGTGVLYEDIPFPVFYIEDEENLQFAKECFIKHNNHSFNTQRDRSLCSLELKSFMFGTRNTPTCIRRSESVLNVNPVKFCDPLGDQNVFSTLFPRASGENLTEPITGFQYIIVATRLDTTSMFEMTAGAISPVTGLVTLLSTAQILKKMLPTYTKETKNVLFVIFNGESYDYIGSSRLLYDMLKGDFPSRDSVLPKITPKDIKLFVELSQLNKTGKIVGHYSNQPKEFVLDLSKNSRGESLNFTSQQSLPPASLHTFLKHDPELPGLVLTDHSESYMNEFYNSIYDNATNLNFEYMNLTKESGDLNEDNIQSYIGHVSLVLAKSLYQEITGKPFADDLKPDLQIIDELFHCYLENSNCRVHQAIQKLKLPNSPMSLYVGVDSKLNLITTLVGLTLGWITGDIVGESNINCTNYKTQNYAVQYFNFSASLDDLKSNKCYRTTLNFTDAISPAFIIDNYNWTSGQYSTWSESTWGEFNVRLFLKPSAAHENMTIAIGSIVLIFSFLLVYFIKSRSDVLFAPPLPTLAPTNC